jgi:hypothetical protein
MLFSDIMQEENVNLEEMQPIYDGINLSKMGTRISNYKNALTECGFSSVETDLFLHTISEHYSSILEVVQEKGQDIGLSPEYLKPKPNLVFNRGRPWHPTTFCGDSLPRKIQETPICENCTRSINNQIQCNAIQFMLVLFSL